MEITCENFEEIFPAIVKGIDKCDFFSLDWELTGLDVTVADRGNIFDTTQEDYAKRRRSAQNFIPNQFGLALFTCNNSTNEYDVEVYNIYVFPRRENRSYRDKVFLCSASGFNFLTEHNFDFNKWIKGGVSYLSPFEEAALRKSRPSRTAESESKIELNEADAAYIDHTRTVLDEFLANQKTSVDLMEVEGNHADAKDEKKEKTENQDSQHEEKDIENTLPPNQLFLPQPNSYKRKMIYDEIGRSHPTLVLKTSTRHSSVGILVTAMSAKEKEEHEEKERIEFEVGFRRVIDKLKESRKPLVGHNCWLDLLHIQQHFISPLPLSVEEWKKQWTSFFPITFDTKHLFTFSEPTKQLSLPSSHLGGIYEAVMDPAGPFPHHEIKGHVRYEGEGSPLHEAGFDALITGRVFIAICHLLTSEPSVSKFLESEVVQSLSNRLHMMFKVDSCLGLLSSDVVSFAGIENTFALGPFMAVTVTKDLVSYFQPLPHEFYIKWYDENTAFLIVKGEISEEQRGEILKMTQYSIRTYREYVKDKSRVFEASLSSLKRPHDGPRGQEEGEPPEKKAKMQ